MNYVCTVVGKLVFDDINLELNYMEIIDLSPADFKSSPRIRDAYQKKQLVTYDPRLHPNAKRFNRFTKDTKLSSQYPSAPETTDPKKQEVRFSELNDLKHSLEALSDKMNGLVNKMNIFINQQIESNARLNENFQKFFEQSGQGLDTDKFNTFVDKSLEHHSKMEEIWEKRLSDKDAKIDKLLNKLDEFMDKGVKVNGATAYNAFTSGTKKDNSFDDRVTFIPQIEITGVKTSIKTQELQQEGTDDVLAKLRAMNK